MQRVNPNPIHFPFPFSLSSLSSSSSRNQKKEKMYHQGGGHGESTGRACSRPRAQGRRRPRPSARPARGRPGSRRRLRLGAWSAPPEAWLCQGARGSRGRPGARGSSGGAAGRPGRGLGERRQPSRPRAWAARPGQGGARSPLAGASRRRGSRQWPGLPDARAARPPAVARPVRGEPAWQNRPGRAASLAGAAWRRGEPASVARSWRLAAQCVLVSTSLGRGFSSTSMASPLNIHDIDRLKVHLRRHVFFCLS